MHAAASHNIKTSRRNRPHISTLKCRAQSNIVSTLYNNNAHCSGWAMASQLYCSQSASAFQRNSEPHTSTLGNADRSVTLPSVAISFSSSLSTLGHPYGISRVASMVPCFYPPTAVNHSLRIFFILVTTTYGLELSRHTCVQQTKGENQCQLVNLKLNGGPTWRQTHE